MRDFRYLRVVEHRLVGFLQSPGGRSLYEIYENHEGNKREKRNSEEKTTRLSFFFNRSKPPARHYCESHSHLQTKFCIKFLRQPPKEESFDI